LYENLLILVEIFALLCKGLDVAIEDTFFLIKDPILLINSIYFYSRIKEQFSGFFKSIYHLKGSFSTLYWKIKNWIVFA